MQQHRLAEPVVNTTGSSQALLREFG